MRSGEGWERVTNADVQPSRNKQDTVPRFVLPQELE